MAKLAIFCYSSYLHCLGTQSLLPKSNRSKKNAEEESDEIRVSAYDLAHYSAQACET